MGEPRALTVASPVAELAVKLCGTGHQCRRYGIFADAVDCPGHGSWEATKLPLDEFVNGVCVDDLVWELLPGVEKARTEPEPSMSAMTGGAWASRRSRSRYNELLNVIKQLNSVVATARAERYRAEAAEREKTLREVRRRQEEIRRQQQEKERHVANVAALVERQQRLTPTAVRWVTDQTGAVPWILPADFEHAMGVSIMVEHAPAMVVCPVESRIDDEVAGRMLNVTILVASDAERRRVADRCRPGQRIVVQPVAPSADSV
ncbi:hypothetical protein AB0M46_08465 [Dactylosporangium sp. NPDC051485]|uniref:hypothetical protein n=1 Tax=Dactylosporangium sp. NPDC051485 TaxID=3154846 RepID=UPI00341BB384